jgi:hypothetical protein
MTTETTIHPHHRAVINKMVQRLESVNLTIIDAYNIEWDAYHLYGTNAETDSGAIIAPSGSTAWTFMQLMDLLAKIKQYGRPTMCRLTAKSWKNPCAMSVATIAVPAGEDSHEVAATVAGTLGMEVHELIEVK